MGNRPQCASEQVDVDPLRFNQMRSERDNGAVVQVEQVPQLVNRDSWSLPGQHGHVVQGVIGIKEDEALYLLSDSQHGLIPIEVGRPDSPGEDRIDLVVLQPADNPYVVDALFLGNQPMLAADRAASEPDPAERFIPLGHFLQEIEFGRVVAHRYADQFR